MEVYIDIGICITIFILIGLLAKWVFKEDDNEEV